MSITEHEPIAFPFHIPFTDAAAPARDEREPSQERDVSGDDFRGPSQPVGPRLANELIEQLGGEGAARLLHHMWVEANTRKKERDMVIPVGGTADGSGNLDLVIYDVPQGYTFKVTRVNLEAVVGGTLQTPAAPFSAANAWLALMRGTNFSNVGGEATASFGNGSMLDFAPATAGSRLFPGLFTWSKNHAPLCQSGTKLGLHVVGTGTFANAQVYCRVQGVLTDSD